MKRAVLFIMIVCIVLAGCQKTPEKSSIANKADGLSENVITEPLKRGEKITLDVPQHWTVSEKKSDDRVTISANLELGEMKVGNLPVIEMRNHELTNKELDKLVSYFTEGEDLYVPEIYTKDNYQRVIDRIEKKEGSYSNVFMGPVFQELDEALKNAARLAPETPSTAERAEIKFQKKTENPALAAAEDWSGGKKNQTDVDADAYFSADVGEDRGAYIEAERYNSDIENSSSFTWQEGAKCVEADDIQYYLSKGEYKSAAGLDTSGYTEELEDLLNQYTSCLEQQKSIDEMEGKKQAEEVLQDLDIKGMELLSAGKVLWFPGDASSERDTLGYGEDYLWQRDLTQAEVGYQYTFSRYVEGIPAKPEYGIISEQTTESYTPPFPVEIITITITEDGIKGFSWEGMTEEKGYIADNTELLSFEIIQNQLLDQIFYWYSQSGQPQNDPTLFDFNVTSAKLEYTYIPAYEEPKDAWLIPVWVFTVTETSQGLESPGYDSFVLSALDGGVVGRSD